MKISIKFSININRGKNKELETEEEEHHPEGNNFATVETSYQDRPGELLTGFHRNEYYDDEDRYNNQLKG